MKAAATITAPAAVSGQALLESCNFDRRLCACLIITRPDEEQEELLATIVVDNQRRDVTASLAAFRSSLGLKPF